MSGKYEAVVVISTKFDAEATTAMVQKFNDLITANGGTVDAVDEWGKRRLAYLINDEADGYYILYTFTAEAEFIAEFTRILKITDGILRSMIVRKDN